MSKPDEVPQDVWEAAYDAHQYILNTTIPTEAGAILRIARAIMAEREACAEVADAQAVEPDPDDQDPYDEYEMGCRGTARRLAAAIRNRGAA